MNLSFMRAINNANRICGYTDIITSSLLKATPGMNMWHYNPRLFDKLLSITIPSSTGERMSIGKVLWLQLQYFVAAIQLLQLLLKQQGMLESKGKSASSWEVMCRETLTSIPHGGFPTLQVFKPLINSY